MVQDEYIIYPAIFVPTAGVASWLCSKFRVSFKSNFVVRVRCKFDVRFTFEFIAISLCSYFTM